MLGDARRLEGRAVGELPIRRFLAALDSLPAKGSMVRERPLEGGGLVCENTPGPEPVPGPRPGGSLPPRRPRPRAAQKAGRHRTQLESAMEDRRGGACAHTHRCQVCIDPQRLIHVPVRHRRVGFSSEPRPREPLRPPSVGAVQQPPPGLPASLPLPPLALWIVNMRGILLNGDSAPRGSAYPSFAHCSPPTHNVK